MDRRVPGRFVAAGTPSTAGMLRQTFRGLHLRTHPDSDVSASQIMLVKADEIIMDDGTRITDWNQEVGDITASGAGGLDTGAEAASAWYDIWAIGQSSNGTGTRTKHANDKLLFHRSKTWETDAGQQFTTTDDAGRALRLSTGTATDLLAQGFKTATAGFPGDVVFIDANLVKNGTPTGNIWFEIRSDNAGSPDAVLATSTKLDASKVSTADTFLRFVFRTPTATANTTTQYHLVFNGDYAKSDANNISWRGVAAGGYANGAGQEYNGTVWAGASGVGDFNFRIYTARNTDAVTMPATYDQKALIGYVRNNASSNFKKFIQLNEAVKTLAGAAGSSSEWATGTVSATTTPALLDLAAFLPPTVVIPEFGTSGGSYLWLGTYAFASVTNHAGGHNDDESSVLWAAATGDANQILALGETVPVEYQGMMAATNNGTQTPKVLGWRF